MTNCYDEYGDMTEDGKELYDAKKALGDLLWNMDHKEDVAELANDGWDDSDFGYNANKTLGALSAWAEMEGENFWELREAISKLEEVSEFFTKCIKTLRQEAGNAFDKMEDKF